MSNDVYQSPKLKTLRTKITDQKTWQCEQCGSTETLSLHHKSYIDTIFDEDPDHYEVICKSCFGLYHTRRGNDFKKASELK